MARTKRAMAPPRVALYRPYKYGRCTRAPRRQGAHPARAAIGREGGAGMGLRGGVWARPILASALALGLAPGAHAWMIIGLSPGYHNQARPIHPAPAVWRTASLGRPGPAAPDWPRPAIVIRDARGDTEYRWGLVPGGLARSGAPQRSGPRREHARGGRRRPAPAPARGPCRRRPVGLGTPLCHVDPLHVGGRGDLPQRPIHARARQRPRAADLYPRTGLGRPRAPSVVGPGRRLCPRTTALTARAHCHQVSNAR